MSLKKSYYKTKPVCKVTFSLSKNTIVAAEEVNLTGEFNNWDVESIPMKKTKTGEFSTSIELENGREYQFRYIVDGKWINDPEADKYITNEFQGKNSVVII